MVDTLEAELIARYSPYQESLHNRYFIYKLLKASIYRALEKKLIKVTVYGSLPLRTFLKDGDIDITVITTPEDSHYPHQYIQKIRSQLSQDFELLNLQEVLAEVPLLKFKVFNINIDVSINQIGGVRSLIFLEEISRLFPKHLLKRSFILCKAWATHFSRILGSMHGLLSTYALEILVLFILNTVPEARASSISVLSCLIQYFESFDWENYVITCCGIIPYRKASGFMEAAAQGSIRLQLSCEKIKGIREELKCTSIVWGTRFINIADPVCSGNNLGRSVSGYSFQRIKFSFQVAAEIYREHGVEGLFKNSVPQVAIRSNMVGEAKEDKQKVPISFFANIRKLKEALFSCLAVMDPSFPQNY